MVNDRTTFWESVPTCNTKWRLIHLINPCRAHCYPEFSLNDSFKFIDFKLIRKIKAKIENMTYSSILLKWDLHDYRQETFKIKIGMKNKKNIMGKKIKTAMINELYFSGNFSAGSWFGVYRLGLLINQRLSGILVFFSNSSVVKSTWTGKTLQMSQFIIRETLTRTRN